MSEMSSSAHLLLPLELGWRRELVHFDLNHGDLPEHTLNNCPRQLTRVHYTPPVMERCKRSRRGMKEATRPRTSKADQERYLLDFPSSLLSISNFSFAPRPLNHENESCRQASEEERRDKDPDDLDDDDEEVNRLTASFDPQLSLCLQSSVCALQSEHRKRHKRAIDEEHRYTPPSVDDQLWTEMDDDPLGVYTALGGRSSPATPPLLRSLKLTHSETAVNVISAFQYIREESSKRMKRKMSQSLCDDRHVSHDLAISKAVKSPCYGSNTRLPFITANTSSQAPTNGVSLTKPPLLWSSDDGKKRRRTALSLTNGPRNSSSIASVTSTKKIPIDRETCRKPNSIRGGKEEVSVLVQPQRKIDGSSVGSPVLLNVPLAVGERLKTGITLSFAVEGDIRYRVIDTKLHPPVVKQCESALPKRTDVTCMKIAKTTTSSSVSWAVKALTSRNFDVVHRQKPLSSNHQSSSRLQSQPSALSISAKSKPLTIQSSVSIKPIIRSKMATTPCTPHCPGVQGAPEVECSMCRSLFHLQCLGLPLTYTMPITFRCGMCQPSLKKVAFGKSEPRVSIIPLTSSRS